MTSEEDATLQQLADSLPQSTDAERRRFLKARKGDAQGATVKLREYLEWRAMYRDDESEGQAEQDKSSDSVHWELASRISLKEALKKEENVKNRKDSEGEIPQIIMLHTDNDGCHVKERSGHMLLHAIPAQVDKNLACAETYGLAMALYLDRKFDRDSMHQATILLDVRPGGGWSNPKAFTMMSFIRTVSKILHQFFPERLHKCIVYPLPRAALWIWEMAKPFLDRDIVETVMLVSGSDAIDASPPNEELSKYIDESILEQIESARCAAFV